MEGQKAILNKILDEANATANDIALKVAKDCENKIIEANAWASEYTETQNTILKQDIQNILSGKRLTCCR